MTQRRAYPSEEAVASATGHGWAEWHARLDAAGANGWTHRAIVAHLRDVYGLSGWWPQTIAVVHEVRSGLRVPGQTCDGDFQVGVRRTLPAPPEAVWQALVSPAGRTLWLGPGATGELEPGTLYRTEDGYEGEIRVVKPGVRVRLTRGRAGEPARSTVQIALAPSGAKTTVTFHQEKLASAGEREAMRLHWHKVAEQFADRLADFQTGEAP